MNMLTNRVQSCLWNAHEIKSFNRVGKQNCEYLSSSTTWITQKSTIGTFRGDGVYRLELKIGGWYTYRYSNGDNKHTMMFVGFGHSECPVFDVNGVEIGRPQIEEYSMFRPATQEEIDSVKPTPKFIDVGIEWEDEVYAKVNGWDSIGNSFEEINRHPIGFHCGDGWILSCYVHDGFTYPKSSPILFDEVGMSIKSKATHARFVKEKRK